VLPLELGHLPLELGHLLLVLPLELGHLLLELGNHRFFFLGFFFGAVDQSVRVK
jgi:hypothetical protein